jgi:hypothetical protein
MKQLYLLLFFVSITTAAEAQTLDPLWLKQIASAQSGGGISFDESVDLIETDSEGNVYVAGFVQDGAFFDTTSLGEIGNNQYGYLAKFSCGGNLLWVKQFGATNNSAGSPSHLEIDDDRITLSIPYSSAQNNGFFIDTDTTFFDSPGSVGNICVSYDTAGNYQWHWGNGLRYQRGVFPNITSFEFLSEGATQDLSGQVYVLSRSTDTGVMEGLQISDTATFLTKLNNDGALDTIFMICPKPLFGLDIKYLKENELLIRFGTTLPLIIGGDTFTSGGGQFLAKIDTLGNFYWANNAQVGIGDFLSNT